MIELFSIFSKGGIVFWCFQESEQLFTDSINQLIRDVLMQGRGGCAPFNHKNSTIKYKLDNEFELIFLIVYQSAVQLSYTDQLLSDVHKKFRDMYKNVLVDNRVLYSSTRKTFQQFSNVFQKLYQEAQLSGFKKPEKVMRTFEESEKSKKTIASIIDRPFEKVAKSTKDKSRKKHQNAKAELGKKEPVISVPNGADKSLKDDAPPSDAVIETVKDGIDFDEIQRKRMEFFKKNAKKAEPERSAPVVEAKKGKQARVWGLSGKGRVDVALLDYSEADEKDREITENEDRKFVEEQMLFVGQLKGELPGLEVEESDENDEDEEIQINGTNQTGRNGWFSAFRSLVGNKKLTRDDVQSALEKMRETLITKNVAAEAADKLCQSVASRLEGKVVGTFNRVSSIVKESFREALVHLLTPKRRVDILRDVLEAKRESRPYVIVFCGVNGVGKSTNLAKITFWLNENGHRVLIAAGDTFRAGAVEQLRTHARHLNVLHPNSVQLFEQGYGKDPAGLAAAAIASAVERAIDVVLVDTAGRMQDNEPLMRSLAKLIRLNEPDLVLFVGEALVGNEAVDQLVKFNQALADHAAVGAEARLIDGIILTKFDTIDEKVGAAISMTYITGQPIVFVGTGQTYKDLKNLSVNAVVHALLK